MRDDVATIDPRQAGQLIGKIATGQDRAAFRSLFEFYAPRVKAMLMRIGVDDQVAEDVAQETLLTVWRKASYYDPARASASAWIYTIARNLRIDRARRENRARLYEVCDLVEPDEPERPDAPLDALQRNDRVRASLDRLPPDQLQVIELSFFQGYAHGDIAAQLGIPLGTVKSRLRLAMARLRDYLGDAR
jgi:RNA polymerase sigma-70 factor (ECF subfamily)